MPLNLTPKQLDKLWDDSEKLRTAQVRRQRYFDGQHDVTKREEEEYRDGFKKSGKVANWIKYIIQQYVGTLTDAGFQVSNNDDGDEGITPVVQEEIAASAAEGEAITVDAPTGEITVGIDGANVYNEIADWNSIGAENVEVLREALLKGIGPEVHEFVDGNIVIRSSCAENWCMVYDTTDELVGALYQFCVKEGEVHEGEYYDRDTDFRVWYDDSSIKTYRRASGNKSAEWAIIGDVRHFYGMVPVVDWHINRRRMPFIDDAIIGQQDEYNEVDSIAGDDIRREVDAFLAFKDSEFDFDWIIDNAAKIKELRMLPCEASYVTKSQDTNPITSRLTRTREHIHMMGQVPDVAQIVGTTGATSGIALQLKFLPMDRCASEMINYLKRSMHRRIDLINAVHAKAGRPIIENVTVTITFSLPTNEHDEWTAVRQLDGLVSKRKQLEILAVVDDVEKEMDRIAVEQSETRDNTSTPQELGARQEAAITAGAQGIQPSINELVDAIAALAVDKVVTTGAAERTIAKKQRDIAGEGAQ